MGLVSRWSASLCRLPVWAAIRVLAGQGAVDRNVFPEAQLGPAGRVNVEVEQFKLYHAVTFFTICRFIYSDRISAS